jgi:DNA-binding transcriptional LysR family regulator
MHAVHTTTLDLNLLQVFAAVHEAKSVSRAAERLNLSQPAVSHALTRLRLAFHDPLFTRSATGVKPTPRADQVARQVEAALRLLQGALHEAQGFDAAVSQRRFVLHMSDLGAAYFLPALTGRLAAAAPGVQIEVVQLAPQAIGTALEEGRLDLAIGFLPQLAGTESIPLLEERYVLLMRRQHPLTRGLRRREPSEAMRSLHYAVVASHTEPQRALQALGLAGQVRLTLPHFTAAPSILEATDLALVLPTQPARQFAARHDLQVLDLPLGLPPFEVAMHWTWRHNHDPGHRWLRENARAVLVQAPRAKARRNV